MTIEHMLQTMLILLILTLGVRLFLTGFALRQERITEQKLGEIQTVVSTLETLNGEMQTILIQLRETSRQEAIPAGTTTTP
jgi:hypothetical protein